MKRKEHRGYIIVAQAREDPLGSGEWFPRWTATRLDKPSPPTLERAIFFQRTALAIIT